jgi:hypothetical protein
MVLGVIFPVLLRPGIRLGRTAPFRRAFRLTGFVPRCDVLELLASAFLIFHGLILFGQSQMTISLSFCSRNASRPLRIVDKPDGNVIKLGLRGTSTRSVGSVLI